MGQAVKYAALGAALIVVLGLVATAINMVSPSSILEGFASSLADVFDAVGSFFRNVRGAVNYFFGTPVVLNIAIAFWIAIPFAKMTYKIAIATTRFINQ